MCILQKVAKPTGIGVWWQDDSKWCQYGQEHDAQIRQAVENGLSSIDLGVIKSSVHPTGARYTAELNKMEQVAVSSGQVRPIVIVDGPAAQRTLLESKPPQLALEIRPSTGSISTPVHYKDSSGNLLQYDKEIANALLEYVARGSQRSLVLEHKKSRRTLYFDLQKMEQSFVESVDSDSGDPVLTSEPPVKVFIEVPWNPEAMLAIVRKAEGLLRKKLLAMTVDRYRSEEYLEATLPDRAYPRRIISKSVYSELCLGHPTYDKFLEAVEHNLRVFPNGTELFIKHSVPGENQDNSVVKTVFKPMKRKMDSEMTFWVSMAAPLAAAHAVVYGPAIVRIMAYLVIDTNFAKTGKRLKACNSEVLEIKQREHCLSLAELSVG